MAAAASSSSSSSSTQSSSSSSALLALMQHDWAGADMLISLAAAALRSYRHESALRPFPPAFTADGPADTERCKDVDGLRAAVAALPPPVPQLLPSWQALGPRSWDALDTFLQPRGLSLVSMSPSMVRAQP